MRELITKLCTPTSARASGYWHESDVAVVVH